MLREVNQNPVKREAYFEDKAKFVSGYPLTDEEREAFLNFDIGRMYKLGVHGLILRPFTLLHQVAEPDYLEAIRK